MKYSFLSTFSLAFLGLAICTLMERYVKPRPHFRRPLAAWSIHIGICLLTYGVLVLILARPYFSLICMLTTMLTFVIVNNTKMQTLEEPLTIQDVKFFKNGFIHPRLFFPYMTTKQVFFALSALFLVLVLFFSEPAISERWHWFAQGGAIFLISSIASISLCFAYIHTPSMCSHVLQTHGILTNDLRHLGFIGMLWVYAFASRQKPNMSKAPFSNIQKKSVSPMPHLIAIQSESFFDPRSLFQIIRPEILTMYDKMCQESTQYGLLQVPVFGAYTMRTEFSFLTGIKEKHLGIHRFDPYELASTGYYIPSVFHLLKKLGYEIIVVHPYAKTFFSRHKVFSHFQVDKFIDITHFSQNDYSGPYISDVSVGKTILEIIHNAKKPTFVFSITMENHGPLHLEKVQTKDIDMLYNSPPPHGFENLTIYLRHLRQADTMISLMRDDLQKHSYPVSLCWYGDHKPIMPKIYETLPTITSDTNYFLWNNPAFKKIHKTEENTNKEKNVSLASHELASYWLNQSLWI